ncbi:unnamed protein product [Mytilus coruscus]|uniref:exodeoxyribonuclease III n=1 Tax=Mytilus coruscus TaxID=42192 RepID=A0A6J8EK46_MYTCO|nr:unnamed protein product [Mytilus coruscus]
MSSLRLLAWNVRGIMSSTVCLSSLLKNTDCDVSVISEHKLKKSSLHYLSTIEQGYTCIGKAEDLPNSYHAYHGKGGVAILYKNTLQFSVSEIHGINSEKIVGLQIKSKSNGSIFIFGAYLPSDDSIDNYRNELNMLDTLVSYYCNYGSVIVAGDLNASCRMKDRLHSNQYKSDELQKFVKRHDMLFSGGKIKHTGPDYTFITKKTMIDYFLVNRSVLGQLRSCEILDEGSISSTSDHLPIIVELLIDNNPHRIMNSFGKFPAWHKIDDKHIRNYQEFIDVPLELLTDRIISDNVEVNTVNTEIEIILHAAADSVIPTCGFNPYTKPYWTPDVKKAHQTERSMRKRWLADGRPRGMSHESYKHYKKAKYEFRNVQHAAYEQYIQKCYDDINEAAECDIRLF